MSIRIVHFVGLSLMAAGCQLGFTGPGDGNSVDFEINTLPVVAVGDSVGLAVKFYSSPRAIVWRVREGDEGKVAIEGSRYRALAPGSVTLVASTGQKWQEASALVAVVGNPAPDAKPLTPAGLPFLSQNGFRVFRTEEEWRNFVSPVTLTDMARPDLAPPPVDFSRSSVLLLMLDDISSRAVVTHYEGNSPLTIHVTFPSASRCCNPIPGGYSAHVISMTELPKLPADGDVRVYVRTGGQVRHDGLMSPLPDPSPMPTASALAPIAAGAPTADANRIQFREVFREKPSDKAMLAKLKSTVLKSDGDWETLGRSLGFPLDSQFMQRLKLNFESETGILAALPVQPDTGPNISIQSIADGSPCIQVNVSRILPPPGIGAGATETMPIVYVAIPRNTGSFCFTGPVDVQGR